MVLEGDDVPLDALGLEHVDGRGLEAVNPNTDIQSAQTTMKDQNGR